MADDQIQREIEFSLVSMQNLERFSEMFELCFGACVGTKYFDWKYRENPIGPLVAFEAIHQGKSIASYGVIPELYEVEGQPIRIYQSMDTMTHPAYQRRGLFQKLAMLTYDHLIKQEAHLDMIGIPGPSSYPGFVKKLQWQSIHHFDTLFLPRSLFRISFARHRAPQLNFKIVRELTQDLSKFLEQRPKSRAPIRNELSPAFFNWRVFGHPLKRFNVMQIHEGRDLIGVLVYTTDIRRRTAIYFLELVREDLLSAYTLAIIRQLFSDTNSVMLTTWKPMNSLLHAAYQRCGFVFNPFQRGPMAYRQPLIVRSESGRVGNTDWCHAANYDLQPIMQD
jgi:hypothetical protein